MITPEMLSALERVSFPDYAGCFDRYILADLAHRAHVALTSPVYCLVRNEGMTGEQLLGVYRTKELAETAHKVRFHNDDVRIEAFLVEAFLVEDEVEE